MERTIRVVSPDDAAELLALYRPYVEDTAISFEWETPTLEEFTARIRRTLTKYPYLVLEQAGELLGYAYLSPFHTRAAYAWGAETTIYLAPAARRLGLGTMLYHGLLAALAKQGYRNAYAVLADPNPESEAFHTAFGFVCEGRQARTGYKNGWQGVSYWLLDLADPAADQSAPPVPPSPLPVGQLEEVLAAARLGEGWQTIAGR